MSDRYDLVIIGGGPAGYTAALEAVRLGMRTALAESRELGGTCLNRGCIPTKTILHSAGLYAGMREGAKFGVTAGAPAFDMGAVRRRKEEVIAQLRGGIELLMKKNRVTVLNTAASIAGPHTVLAGERELWAEKILIATGSVPALPPIPGAELEGVVTSDGLLDRGELFPSLLIVGGGVIGMEFASIYNDFGVPVTVVEFMDNILPGMDREISRNLKMILSRRGVEFHTGARVEAIEKAEDGQLSVRYLEKDKPRESRAAGVLIATGRRPNTGGLFAGDFALPLDRGRVIADGYGRTAAETVYAAGDVTGGVMLAHAASAQAVNAVRHMAGEPPLYRTEWVPGCVYTNPEIAYVGLTQEEARARGLETVTKKAIMSANGKTVLEDLDRSFIKVTAEASTGTILGAQLMCARATDMVSQFTAALVNGLTLGDLASVIYPHPTFSEAIGEAAR